MKKIVMMVVCSMAVVNISLADNIRGISIDFVTIGNAGNDPDTQVMITDGTSGYGAVNYDYRIGKYEITATQWQTINTAAGIGDSGNWSGNQPVADISWYEAAQFCNYLTSGNKYSGAYKFDISGNFQEIDRVSSISTYGTTYVVPTDDEWYKAAYYKSDDNGYSLYANGTDTAPIAGVQSNYEDAIGVPWDIITNGTQEQNGTFDMMGNVLEWDEDLLYGGDGYYGYRVVRGGAYDHRIGDDWYYFGFYLSSLYRGNSSIDPDFENEVVGFRIASIPEPTTCLLFLGSLSLLRRKQTH